jgi:hypothetical protein
MVRDRDMVLAVLGRHQADVAASLGGWFRNPRGAALWPSRPPTNLLEASSCRKDQFITGDLQLQNRRLWEVSPGRSGAINFGQPASTSSLTK